MLNNQVNEHARDSGREPLIKLFVDAEITTESEIAALLGMTMAQFWNLWANRLPMNNENIAGELGVKIERVYKLRCNAYKRLKQRLSAMESKKLAPRRKKPRYSPS